MNSNTRTREQRENYELGVRHLSNREAYRLLCVYCQICTHSREGNQPT